MNTILAKDRHKVRLSKFDESDPKQHIQKCMVGCGTYFCFRGESEHANLMVDQVIIGDYEPEHEYAGFQFASIGQLVNDKKQKLDANNSWVRDTSNLVRILILDTSDNTNTNDFGASLKRLKQKAVPGQTRLRFYSYWNKDGIFFKKRPIGKEKIRKFHKDAADDHLGIDPVLFRGGHVWRNFAITTMVNDPRVSNGESMKAACHSSVSAHLAYQSTDIISEHNRMASLLRQNNPQSAHGHLSFPVANQDVEVLSSMSKNRSHMHSSDSMDTQPDLEALEEDLATEIDDPLNSKQEYELHGEDLNDFMQSQDPMNTQQEFEALETEVATAYFLLSRISMVRVAESLDAMKIYYQLRMHQKACEIRKNVCMKLL